MIKYSSSVNYYFKKVISLEEKHLSVDLRWDCNEGMNKLMLIFV